MTDPIDATAVVYPSIYVLMARVLADLPAIGKDRENTDQNFKFRGIDQVVDELNGKLAEHGVFYLPTVVSREVSSMERGQNRSVWRRIDLGILYTFYGPNGDSVTALTWGEGLDNGDKATSKAHTMAQKTCLVQAFCIATKDMDDPDAGSPPEQTASDAWGGWDSDAEARAAHDELVERLRTSPPDVQQAVKAWRTERGLSLPLPKERFQEFADFALTAMAQGGGASGLTSTASEGDSQGPARPRPQDSDGEGADFVETAREPSPSELPSEDNRSLHKAPEKKDSPVSALREQLEA